MSNKGCFLIILILFSGNIVVAQKTVSNQNLYWLRYFNQLSFNAKHSLHTEIEDRRFFEGNTQHHFIMHSRFNTKVYPNTEVSFGLTFSRQSPQDPKSNSTLIIPEIRPNQEITYSNAITKKFSVQHRFRIDERFIRKNNGVTLLDGNNFNLRLRYRLLMAYKFSTELPLTLKLANELMINSGKQIVYNQFDQNRISLGLEKTLNKNLALEMTYIYWYQQRPTGNQFFERNILRFTVIHKIALSKNETK